MTDGARRGLLGGLAGLSFAGSMGWADRARAGEAPVTPGASDYVWRSVKVGGGGFVPGIVFSRVEKGLAYLRSDMGGAYRWEATAGAWTPLQDADPRSNDFGIESIAPDPVDADVVYAAVGTYRREPAAMLRSRDRGASWDRFEVGFRMGGNEPGRGIGERLAVDPNDTAVLYFGSRHDGLHGSLDHGATWAKVASFPVTGRGLPTKPYGTNAGISFVVFDPASGARGARTRTILVGVADPGAHHLFRSDDAGETWAAVAGEPRAELLPVKAEIDDRGVIYIAYGNGVGPTGVTDGAVFKLDTHTGAWTDISPDKRIPRPRGGYMGLSLDRQRPGTLVVSTMNRWKPGDDVWRSTDGGATWVGLAETSVRDVSATPFLRWGGETTSFGWWIAALAIDPFDSDFVAYATGATLYATRRVSDRDRDEPTHWFPWVEGIEQTAILTLTSPPAGPALLSGFGDIGGFAHWDLRVSPSAMFSNPVFDNTNTIDYAALKPNVLVRCGAQHEGDGPTLGYSEDFGRTWRPLIAPPAPGAVAPPVDPRGRGGDPYRDAAIVVSADGGTFMVMTPAPQITRDRGRSWRTVRGLPPLARPVADRVDPKRFYALDFATGDMLVSSDAGASFARVATRGLPLDIRADRPTWREDAWPLRATPGRMGELWFVSRLGLFHSRDGGRVFVQVGSPLSVEMLDFGKAAPGRDHPALFAVGTQDGMRAIWRSDDAGRSWLRVNDARHEYGRAFRCIAGDPRVFGRVYVGTDGRGILYGEPPGRLEAL